MQRLREEHGASLVEYALLLACVAMVAVGAITFLGQQVDENLDVHIAPASTATP